MPAENKPGARQLFYSTQSVAPGVAGFVESQQEVKRRAKLTDVLAGAVPGIRYTLLRRAPDGSFLEADPTTTFHAGEAVRLSIQTNSAGYLAVWDGDNALANLPVVARTQYVIPAKGAIELNGPGGDRKLLVVFSRRAENKPVALTGALLVEQSKERATYVAEPRPSPRVSFEITLTYR
jgi:hypothetical protein